MLFFKQLGSELKLAVLLGVALTAVAHLPPLYLAQRLDALLLGGLSTVLAKTDSDIVIIDPVQFDALPTLASGAQATIIGPNAIAIGPLAVSTWTGALSWLLAISGLLVLVASRHAARQVAWLVATAMPVMLLISGSAAFALANIWVPAAGPMLLLIASGALALRAGTAPLTVAPARSGRAEVDSGSFAPSELEGSWQNYRELPATSALLPDLFELGKSLHEQGKTQLAADSFHRVALLDPDFEDVAARLVSAGRAEDPAVADVREGMRRGMPRRVGRYRLLEPIGQGTTGLVYLAWDPKISRLLAIKLIDLSQERDEIEQEDARERFLQEAEITGRLSHPNIVTIHDMGQKSGNSYIAMEYLKGDVLSLFTAPETLLPPRLTLELCALTADALDFAHSQNVIHRDIKPGNIMYDSVSGDLKITDFGIARPIDVRRTRTGVVLGTPSFMSPEQIEGGNVKGHTDIFALGVSLYELLTGQLPFRGNSMTDLMFVIANEPHEPVSRVRRSLPATLDRVMDKALNKDPALRFARAGDMAHALRDVARQVS